MKSERDRVMDVVAETDCKKGRRLYFIRMKMEESKVFITVRLEERMWDGQVG